MAKRKEEPAAEPKPKTYLVCFRCPECGMTCSGHLVAHDYAVRICNSPYGKDAAGRRVGLKSGDRCPGTMARELDERNMAL